MIFEQIIYGRKGLHFLKNIVEYNNRSRKQTKVEVDNFLLNSCEERNIETKDYLVTSEKKEKIENVIDIKNFSTLKKLLIIALWAKLFKSWEDKQF